MKIVFATNNPHKLSEARQMAGGRIEILSLADIGCHEELPETHPTIEGNSLQKAAYVHEHYGYDCFADDTGLIVDALEGAPGVMSARYAGEHCTSADNICKLLNALDGVKDEDRTARFRTVVTLCRKGEKPCQFEGLVEGRIATALHGEGGFGYDPIFVTLETGMRFADMTPEAKNAISHRGRAMRRLFDYITEQTS